MAQVKACDVCDRCKQPVAVSEVTAFSYLSYIETNFVVGGSYCADCARRLLQAAVQSLYVSKPASRMVILRSDEEAALTRFYCPTHDTLHRDASHCDLRNGTREYAALCPLCLAEGRALPKPCPYHEVRAPLPAKPGGP